MAEREKSPEGGMWPNNGEIDEKARVWAATYAEKIEAAGDSLGAAEWRSVAAAARRQRDRCYSEHHRRMMNRRVRHGTW